MAIILLFIPTTYAYTSAYHMSIAKILAFVYIIFLALFGALIYIFILTMIGGLKRSDVTAFMKLGGKLGPLSSIYNKISYVSFEICNVILNYPTCNLQVRNQIL